MLVGTMLKYGAISVLGASLLASASANAADVLRTGWVPNVGQRGEGELPLGDLWTFKCPRGGSFSLTIETKDDFDDGTSALDPLVEVVSGDGSFVAFGDDELVCQYEPICGFGCPELIDVPCGQGTRHSLVVRDFGDSGCRSGGGYDLTLSVRRADGRALSERSTDLGGAPGRRVPNWITADYPIGTEGPLLDDEGVPNMGTLSK